ncbi:MAG: hypothetical protein GY754_44020, partial [bacterium]|nr:hypothetical protein [bacterium]
ISFPAQGADICYTIPENTVLPTGASFLLVITANKYGEKTSGAYCSISDRTVPLVNARGISFIHDTDRDEDELGGTVAVTRASIENNITEYRLYWGENENCKLPGHTTPIESLAATGSDLNFSLPENTSVPTGASHLLVFTANNLGEAASGIALDFDDEILKMACNIDGSGSGSNPEYMVVFDNKLYFAANNGSIGNELLRYDGVNPPEEAADMYTGFFGSDPKHLAVFQDELYFQASGSTSHGLELWKYNGVTAVEMGDYVPGYSGMEPDYLTVFNNKLFFRCSVFLPGNSELWSYDGVSDPSLVVDIYDGQSSDPTHLAVFNGELYFNARDGNGHNYELWKYDGSTATEIADMKTGTFDAFYPEHLAVFNDRLYFSAEGDTENGTELWSYASNPVPEDGFEEIDINTGSNSSSPRFLTVFRNKLYFQARGSSGNGAELWCYDGSNAPYEAFNIDGDNNSSYPEHLTVFNNKLYFSANGYNGAGRELWVFYVK